MRKFTFYLTALLFSGCILAQDKTVNDPSIYDIIERTELSYNEIKSLGDAYFEGKDTGKGSGYNQYQRWLYEKEFHLNEQGFVMNPSEEQKEYQRFETENANTNMLVGTWYSQGPTSWNATTGWNPGNGRLTCMAVHPSRRNTIYVGSPGGGVWKTTNRGGSWVPLTDTNADWMNIYSLAIDPGNRNTIYAGTQGSNVIIRSTNGGSSWSTMGSGPTGKIGKIIVHPTNSNIVFAAATNGLWRSTNRGSSWTRELQYNVEDIEFKPGDPNIMYAAGPYVYRSTNNGQSWTWLDSSTGLRGYGERNLLAVSANNPNALYVVQSKGNIFGKLYRSTNSGQSFSTRVTGNTTGRNYFGYEANGIDDRGQAKYDMAIAVNPTNWQDVHIGGIITWRSTNGGASFNPTTEWFYPNNTGYTHSDMHGLEYEGNRLYSLSDGGIYDSTNNGGDWTNRSNGLSIRQFYRMASAPTSNQIYTAGAQDNGSVVKVNSSTYRDWLGADGMEGMVSPTNSNYIWGTSQNGQLYRSYNRGQTRFNRYDFEANWVTPMVMHPTNHNIIYAGGQNGLYKSTNGGSNFAKISGNNIPSNPIDVTIAPSNANFSYTSVGNKIYHSHNDGNNWYTYNTGASGTITDMAVHPTNPQLVYFTTNNNSNSGGRLYSLNVSNGQVSNRSGNLPKIAMRAVALSNNGGKIYVAANIGVYRTSNNGTSYENLTSNLPKVAINDIDIQKGSQYLRVATYGRGIWLYSFTAGLQVTDPTSVHQTEDAQNTIAPTPTSVVYPNPANNELNVNVTAFTDITSIIVSNSFGRVAFRQDNLNSQLGTVQFDVSSLNPGVYVVQILGVNGEIESIKFVKE